MNPYCAIILPIHNEEKSLKTVLTEIKTCIAKNKLTGMEIICVDDHSTDTSAKALANITDIKIVHNDKRLGYGASLKKGISRTKANWVLIMDADTTYPAKYIPQLLGLSDGVDMVIGQRYGKQMTSNKLRSTIRLVMKWLVFLKTGVFYADINSGMRVFKRAVYETVKDKLSDQYSFTTTLSYQMAKAKSPVTSIPIYYKKRVGYSKITPVDYLNSLKLFFEFF